MARPQLMRDISYTKKYGIHVHPAWIAEYGGAVALILGFLVYEYCNQRDKNKMFDDGSFEIKWSDFSEQMGMARKTINNHTQFMANNGMIEIKPGTASTIRRYKLINLWCVINEHPI